MPADPPDPPDRVPASLAEELARRDPATLRAVAAHAEALAAHAEAVAGESPEEPVAEESPEEGVAVADDPPEDWDPDDWKAAVEDAEAPPKATLTVKTINDNDYYYYQWREGETIRSEYVAPVSPNG